MKYSYNWLKDYIVGKMPEPKKLAELLMGRSFEIDSLEKKGQDWVLDIKILSNRAADCLSHIGIAREIAAAANRQMKLPSCDFLVGKKSAKDYVAVQVENKQDCPRYTASVIAGVKVGLSPKWLQDRLVACGLQTINNIVDITNYVMLETGQPLHAFDFDKLGKEIVVRRAKRGETIKTLDKEKTNIVLDESVLVIADEKKPIAIAGIKGGLETGIDKDTKNIVIEAANFQPVLIRRASQKLRLRTDASWRFENGIDLNLIDFAQKRVCYLIQKLAGLPRHSPAGAKAGLVDVSVPLPKPKHIRLEFDYLNRLLGMVIPRDKAVKILDCLGCRVVKKGIFLLAQVPTFRLDLKTPEDLIEEIGRLWGYEKMPKTFPIITLAAPAKNRNFVLENQAKDILVNLGFCEAYNYTFIGEKEKEIFDYKEGELLEIANPMSELNKFLRPSLIPYLLKNTKENLKNFSEVKMFEIGKVFFKKPAEQEKLHLGLVMAGREKVEGLFFRLKGALEALLAGLGAEDMSLSGAISPVGKALLEKLGIKEKAVMAEIDLQSVFEAAGGPKTFQPFSVYPASLRDIALLLPREIEAVDVLDRLKKAGGKLLIEAELFDVYTGPGLPPGKKNLAFHLVYQSQEKTLSTEEVNSVHKKIATAIEKAGWKVRQ